MRLLAQLPTPTMATRIFLPAPWAAVAVVRPFLVTGYSMVLRLPLFGWMPAGGSTTMRWMVVMVARMAISPRASSRTTSPVGCRALGDGAEEAGTDEPDGQDHEPDLARGEPDVGHALAGREAQALGRARV